MLKIRPSQYYIAALRRWISFCTKEPNGLLAGSCWFVLTSLPIITIGPAMVSLVHYMHCREQGIATSWKSALRYALITCGATTWLMSACDLLAIILAGGCVLSLLETTFPIALRACNAILLVFDLLFLLSSLYRYPALCADPMEKITKILARGYLLTFYNLGFSMMYMFTMLLVFMICALTGVGLLLIFPAACAVLFTCAYSETIKRFEEQSAVG